MCSNTIMYITYFICQTVFAANMAVTCLLSFLSILAYNINYTVNIKTNTSENIQTNKLFTGNITHASRFGETSNLTLGRPGGGGGYHPPWRFSPITFLVIPTGKIASVYLILGIEDTFWHMWHHLDAVTWHMSWRQRSMTIDENTVVLPLYVYHDIFWSIRDKAMRLVLFLTFSRSGNSKMLQLVTWPWRMTLKIKVKLP